MCKENSELAMLRLNYDIAKLKQFVYAAEQSGQEASEIIAKLKAENAKLKEKLEKIINLVNRYRSCYAEPILEIIEGAEDV